MLLHDEHKLRSASRCCVQALLRAIETTRSEPCCFASITSVVDDWSASSSCAKNANALLGVTLLAVGHACHYAEPRAVFDPEHSPAHRDCLGSATIESHS